MLSAFDIVHAEPNDPFDLGLGFNIGIIDNDRSRRGELLMADVLNSAVASLSLNGVLGSQSGSDDAHRRLFPSDPFVGNEQQLNEQHIRNLLIGAAKGSAALAAAAGVAGGFSTSSNEQNGANTGRARRGKRRRSSNSEYAQQQEDSSIQSVTEGGGNGNERDATDPLFDFNENSVSYCVALFCWEFVSF